MPGRSRHELREQELSVAEVVERVGFGPAQLIAGFLGGSVYLVGGVIILLVSALALPIAQEWHLRAWERGTLMSALFVGMFIGNSTSGPLGDNFGRKGMIVVCHLCTFVSGLLCVFAHGFWTLCCLRLLLGASMGLGVPPWIVLGTELTPGKWRIMMSAYSQTFFVLGELYSGFAIICHDSTLRHLDWRLLSAIGLLPAVAFGVLSYLFLVQSPAYLAAKGDYAGAQEVLSVLAQQNGKPGDVVGPLKQTASAGAAVAASSSRAQFEVLFGSRMLFTSLTVIYSVFVLNLIFYGTIYAFPQVAGNVDMGTSPAVSMLMGAVWELPGLAAGALLGTWFRRLPVIMLCTAGMATALLSFAFGVSMERIWYSHYVLHTALVGIKLFSNVAFVVVYQYSAEIYPAFARTTGNAVCVSCGRLGAILAPIIFEVLLAHHGQFTSFFLLLALLAAVNFVLVMFLPFETAGMNLDEELEPACPKSQSTPNPWTAIAHKLAGP